MSAMAAAVDEFDQQGISFGFVLPGKPVPHYIGVGETAPAECPGPFASPAAAAGHLCVYESSVSNAGTTLVFNPVDDAPNESATRGFGIYVESAAAGPYWVQAPGP